MLNRSSKYKSIIDGSHYFESKLSIAGVDYTGNTLREIRLSEATFANGVPEVGCAVSKKLTAKLNVTDVTIPRMAQVIPYYRVVDLNDPTNVSEWVSLGTFWIDYREQRKGAAYMTIECYDAMLKAEEVYRSKSNLSFPSNTIKVYSDICTLLGCSIDTPTYNAISAKTYTVSDPGASDKDGSMTMRSVLQNIAAAYCGSFVITADSKLRLITIGNGVLPEEQNLMLTENSEFIRMGDYLLGSDGMLYGV